MTSGLGSGEGTKGTENLVAEEITSDDPHGREGASAPVPEPRILVFFDYA